MISQFSRDQNDRKSRERLKITKKTNPGQPGQTQRPIEVFNYVSKTSLSNTLTKVLS